MAEGLQAGCKTAASAGIPAAQENNGAEGRERTGIPAVPDCSEVVAAVADTGTVEEAAAQVLGRILGGIVGSTVQLVQVE